MPRLNLRYTDPPKTHLAQKQKSFYFYKLGKSIGKGDIKRRKLPRAPQRVSELVRPQCQGSILLSIPSSNVPHPSPPHTYNLMSIINVLYPRPSMAPSAYLAIQDKLHPCSSLDFSPFSELGRHTTSCIVPDTATWDALLPHVQLLKFCLKEHLFFEAASRAQSQQMPLQVGPTRLCQGYRFMVYEFFISFKIALRKLFSKVLWGYVCLSHHVVNCSRKGIATYLSESSKGSSKYLATSLSLSNVYSMNGLAYLT